MGNPGPQTLVLGGRTIGPGERCFLIAEIAQAHDGSLGTAHAYIDAVARAGADAVKFQTHIAAEESTLAEPWRVKFSRQDSTRYDYWRRMEFSPEQWAGLAEHARERGLVFLSSPFSFAALDLLERLDIAAWKVGSGETSNLPLLERMARTRRPVLISTGISDWAEIDRAVETVRRHETPLATLQCTTSYPTPPEKLGLNVIAELRERYRCPVGLSDHSAAIYAGLAAATLGADLLECHVTFSREAFGPDASSSLLVDELGQLAAGVRFLHTALSHRLDKDQEALALADMKRIFGKSVVAARDLPVGHLLAANDLRLKKPGTGIPAARLGEVVGRRLRRGVSQDSLIAEEDLE
jgi:N-acetylneuraminate synthase